MKVGALLETYKGRMTANNEARVMHGDAAQKLIVDKLSQAFGDRFKLVSTAPRSSQVPDIVVDIDGQRYQIEVKSRADRNGVMTLYTKTMWPGKREPQMDRFAKAFSGGVASNFDELMDIQRQHKPGTGWPHEEQSPKSGAINVRLGDAGAISRVRRPLMRYLTQSNDDYLAVVTRATGEVDFYSLGTNKPNALEAKPFPQIQRAVLKTDGGADKGGMRTAVKIQLP